MSAQHCRHWLFLMALCATRVTVADEGGAVSAATATEQKEIRVLDVVIDGTNDLRIGSDPDPLHAATNRIEEHRETIDVIAVHGSLGPDAPKSATAEALETLTRMGIPLVIVEEGGEYAWRAPPGEDGMRTLKVGTDQFAALRRFLQGTKTPATPSGGPSLRTTIDWDTDTGAYQLSRVELGLFGKRVWVMHEQRESDDRPGSVGLKITKEW